MKKEIAPLIVAAFFLGVAVLHSQVEAPKSPLQTLQAIKTANAGLIESQKKTLETLDEMKKTADQIKVYGKRS